MRDGGLKRTRLRELACARSALMRASHHLHGVFEVTPFAGFLGLPVALAGDRILRRQGNRRSPMPLEHLTRDGVDLHLGYHDTLPDVSAAAIGSAVHAAPCAENRRTIIRVPATRQLRSKSIDHDHRASSWGASHLRRASKDGFKPAAILRGAQERAPQDDGKRTPTPPPTAA